MSWPKDAATADRWQQVSQIYLAARERDPAERDAFVREACAGDEGLRREIESLLGYEGAADPWIERPAVALAAPMLNDSASSSGLTGRQVGPYTILALLGAGGMGEVYHARDARLGRDVAIKILPPEVVADANRTARFAREARLLAALNHPHIAQIYGLEQLDPSAGLGHPGGQALVMELVPGETLAALLKGRRHALTVADALALARQIADALEAAHNKGIVHRDLKPANIKVTPEGIVKILDFGLAKVTERISDAEPQLSEAPQMTANGTRQGVILGTAAYMSPEQARGQQVDKRTDIWAFGCVLYEMVTGHVAFAADTVSDTIAKILEREPEWGALPDRTPVSIRRLLQRCLRKDPAQRLHDIADARFEMDEALAEVSGGPATLISTAPRRTSTLWVRVLWALGLLVAGVGAGWLASLGLRPAATTPVTSRFVETLPPGRALVPAIRAGTMVALSPDGRTLVYYAEEKGEEQLYSRSLDRPELRDATPIGEVGASEPFFSHDGQWLAFRHRAQLKRVPVRGGPAQTITRLPGSYGALGASWSEDGTILLGYGRLGLMSVRESGGQLETLVTPAEGRAIWYPQLLPGGRTILYTDSAQRPDAGDLMVFDVATRVSKPLLAGSAGRYLSTGHLAYVKEGTLWAVAFDLDRLKVRGTPEPIIPRDIHVSSTGGAVQVAFSDSGALAHVPATVSFERALVWVDRQGNETPVIGAPLRVYSHPRVSPNGTQIVVTMRDGGQDVYIWDVTRKMLRPVTSDPMPNYVAVWLDDQRLAYSEEAPWARVFLQAADRSGKPLPLTKDLITYPRASSSDGKLLIGTEHEGLGRPYHTVVIPMENPERRDRLAPNSDNPDISPDRQWLAYQSSKTGRSEIYVRPFRAAGDEFQITTEGGTRPLFSRDGTELYYWTQSAGVVSIKAVRIVPGPPSSWSTPQTVVTGPYVSPSSDRHYDEWKGRFLMMKDAVADGSRPRHEIVMLLNWFEELKRRRPVK